nr:putative reverse transcriptase domain-containing protein [Tanacetum cinerariifolium]
MSSSTITYTSVYTDSEPWRFQWVSGEEAPPSLNYVPGLEHPHSPDYVLGLEEPEQAPLSPDNVPGPEYRSYVADSDPEEDPEEDRADYPADEGDDDESSEDDADDKDEEEASKEEDDDEEEEEHLASADSSAIPTVDLVSSAEDTKAFETDESAPIPPSPRPYRAGIYVRLRPPMAALIEARIIPSPPLPIPSPPTARPTYAEAPLGYKAIRIRLRVASPSTHHPSDIPSPPLWLLSTTHRDDILEADMPLHKRARFTAPASRFEVGESSAVTASRQPGLDVATVDAHPWTAYDDRALQRARVHTAVLVKSEARHARQAWSQSMDCNRAVHAELLACQAKVTALREQVSLIQRQSFTDEDILTRHIQHGHDRTSRNGNDSHDSGTGSRKTERAARECTYNDILKCQPPNFKVLHVKDVGHNTAYGMTWKSLMKMLTDKYYPRDEIKKLEIEILNLKNLIKLKRECDGFQAKDHEEANEISNDLMDQKVRSLADRQEGNLMTLQGTTRTNNSLSKGIMWQGPTLLGLVRRNPTEDLNLYALNATTITMGSVLLSAPIARGLAIWPMTVGVQLLLTTIREPQGQIKGLSLVSNVEFRAITKGIARRTNPKSNVITGMFLLNNRYALILFDTGADRSFVSTALSFLIDIIPTTLDHGYNVELADKIGSFDVIISMGWLSKYHAIIVCDEKIVRISFGNEILIVRGDECNNGHESRLNIISCTKTQKYLLKGCKVFLAHITMKKAEDKSKERRLKDVPIVRDFPEVFLEDLPGIPPTRQVEFPIDLIHVVEPVAWAPYRLAPSEMKELSDQLQEHSDKGFIRPSSSSWGALVMFVKKKDASFWMCIDYQKLNKLKSKQEHEENLKLILEFLKKEELYAKFSKCNFWISRVQFLGHVIDNQGIHVDPTKIESIKDWASPMTATEIL